MGIGEKLRKLRKLKEYTQMYVAIQLEVCERTIARIEKSGDGKMSLIKAYCKLLGTDLQGLHQWDPDSLLPPSMEG